MIIIHVYPSLSAYYKYELRVTHKIRNSHLPTSLFEYEVNNDDMPNRGKNGYAHKTIRKVLREVQKLFPDVTTVRYYSKTRISYKTLPINKV